MPRTKSCPPTAQPPPTSHLSEKDIVEIKFHPSQLDKLITNSRSGTDPLSETTKSLLREIYIEHKYGRKKEIRTEAMNKGLMVEADSFRLLHETGNGTFIKNKKTYENESLIGTPDSVFERGGLDIKSAWDLWTFADITEAKVSKNYYYQMLGYMILTKKKHWKVAYCLVDTPAEIAEKELYKKSYLFPELTETQVREKFHNHYHFSDIPAKQRVKIYHFKYSQGDSEELSERIKLWRNYLEGLTI